MVIPVCLKISVSLENREKLKVKVKDELEQSPFTKHILSSYLRLHEFDLWVQYCGEV